MAITLSDHVPLADVKNRLSELVDRVERVHGRVVITKHGRPAAVIVSTEDLESLEATLEILSNPKLVDEIQEAQREIAKGRAKSLTKEEALKLTKRG